MSAYKFIALALYTVFTTTESKFVVYDVIGRNMFLNLLVVVFYRYFAVFRDVLLSCYFLYSSFISSL